MIAVEIMIAYMVIASVVILVIRKHRAVQYVMPACVLGLLAFGFYVSAPVFNGEVLDHGMFYMDKLSSLFMLLAAIVGLMASIYSIAYIGKEHDEKEVTRSDRGRYYMLLFVFISVMMLTFTCRSMALVWIGIGATTLVSTFLVGFYNSAESTEAAWKYIILCCVGITIALAGYSLVYASTIGIIDSDIALDWPALMANASKLDPTMLKMAMVLIIVGFGTKAGFVPMHTWLPDAHSQAPSPISGLLSAVLLNCAMYGILRFYAVSEIALPGFSSTVVLAFGLVSLGAASLFILTAKDLKRMLAYSSIENIGLIAIGFGIGTPVAITAALIQLVAHSLTKPILFFSAGNIIQSYGTRNMADIRGVWKAMPFSAFMMGAGTLAIIGCPPFAVFIGEMNLIVASVSGMAWVTALMIIFLAIVFAGFTLHIFPMLSGKPDREIDAHSHYARYIPLAILFGLTLWIGLFMPEPLSGMIHDIAYIIFGGAL